MLRWRGAFAWSRSFRQAKRGKPFGLTNFGLPATARYLRLVPIVDIGQGIDQCDQSPLHPRILDAGESPIELQTLAAVQEVHQEGSSFLGKTGRLLLVRQTLKE